MIILTKGLAHNKHWVHVNVTGTRNAFHPSALMEATCRLSLLPHPHSAQGTLGLGCQARRSMADKWLNLACASGG